MVFLWMYLNTAIVGTTGNARFGSGALDLGPKFKVSRACALEDGGTSEVPSRFFALATVQIASSRESRHSSSTYLTFVDLPRSLLVCLTMRIVFKLATVTCSSFAPGPPDSDLILLYFYSDTQRCLCLLHCRLARIVLLQWPFFRLVCVCFWSNLTVRATRHREHIVLFAADRLLAIIGVSSMLEFYASNAVMSVFLFYGASLALAKKLGKTPCFFVQICCSDGWTSPRRTIQNFTTPELFLIFDFVLMIFFSAVCHKFANPMYHFKLTNVHFNSHVIGGYHFVDFSYQ